MAIKGKAAAIVAAGVLALTALACGASAEDCKGDPGIVTDKDKDYRTSTKAWDYELVVLRADGTTYDKDVTSTAYGWYKRGSKFPSREHCESDL